MSGDIISPEVRRLLKRLKLGKLLPTLPERLVLARQRSMPHQDFLELILADEVERRDRHSAVRRARVGGLDPNMLLENWDDTAKVTYDKSLVAELTTLRFVEDKRHLLLLGPVGVGKTFLATALAHIACRRSFSVLMRRADRLLKTLKACRLDNTWDKEMRRLIGVDILVLDDFGIDQLDAVESRDIYEIIVERHRAGTMIVTSNRTPEEWLGTMSDPLRAQSAIDRLQNAAYDLVIEGESYRKRQKPTWGKPL